ncbi:sensor histidine kinase [Cohnella nanjingensis]|uniref:Signal transduction histidine-protein kinase ArlS n=1 Tax=Cohnella nanjingensis TaxID=1387779 RepID=A0A7X0VD07_9BACL|nr:HAMP domain-containing histidine kinase [Cohnella nanjingensis]MBB6669487.1 HAMP domain-containing sensor histidine kinase [Cohnella nanjingensis]
MPVKYKLAVWTSGLILLLFIGYSLIQYNAVTQWMIDAQKDSMRRTAAEVAGYFAEQEEPMDTDGLNESRRFMERFVQANQMFRLLDANGRMLMSLSNTLPADWVPAQTTSKESIVSVSHGQDRLLVLRAPIASAAFTGTLELANNLENVDTMKDRLKRLMFTLGAAGIFISALGGFIVAWQLLRPLNRMATAMNAIQQKGLSERVAYRDNGDEISRLSAIFNQMMNELERSFNRQRQFVEDASHEFRTPIAIIEGHLKLLDRWGKNDPDVREESIAAALQETVRLRKLADQLLNLSGESELEPPNDVESIDPSAVLLALAQNYRMLRPGFMIETELEEGLRMRIDPHALEQILIILTDNAIRYSEQIQHVRYRLHSHGHDVHILVEDRGNGIPQEDIPFVFERFYRVDKARGRKKGGAGLGLAIAKRLTEAYGGTIRLDSRIDAGTTVTLIFPLPIAIEKK